MNDGENPITQQPSQPSTRKVTAKEIENYFDEFEKLKASRHIQGASEYGEFGFLDNDLVRYVAEELADLANYAMYMYAKVRLLGEKLNANGFDSPLIDVVPEHAHRDIVGASAFTPDEGSDIAFP